MIISNVVAKTKLRQVQSETLRLIKEYLITSFGPMASNSIIVKATGNADVVTHYSKDGHTILKSILFNGIVERAVRGDLEDLTRYIVKEVGDGTTSAIVLSSLIFDELIKMETSDSPYEIVRNFKECTEQIKKNIKKEAQVFDIEAAYKIALISTNGNETVAANIKNIYKEYGNDVFIDVSTSTTDKTYLKSYDGMTLENGYSDTAFINNSKKGVASLRNPRIYAFEDPIDTPEMIALFNSIIEQNIVTPYGSTDVEGAGPIPTVILAPMISKDLTSYMDQLVQFMYRFKDENTRPPFLLISNIYQKEQFVDVCRLCGCKMIKKYINPDQQAIDVEKGLAPTLDTIVDFYGQADVVESDVVKTKFINPMLMHDKSSGELSQTFTTLVSFLESELKKSHEEGQDNKVIGTLKRRIHSLKANMVEYLVGGVSTTDRDSVRDLVEDAVLNCRSAAKNGVGRGANFEGLIATQYLKDQYYDDKIYDLIFNSYEELVRILYRTKYSEKDTEVKLATGLRNGIPINLRTDMFEKDVLCSIDTDIVILETISKIITLMFTSNQFICPSPADNQYL